MLHPLSTRMEPIVNYLEDTEKKLVKEMADLFSKMREQRESMALNGIEDMYSSKPLEGVTYEPCVRIPGQGGYYCSEYKLPKDEYVIYARRSSHQHMSGQTFNGTTSRCTVLTNYGRCFFTKIIGVDQSRGYSYYTPTTDNNQIHRYINGVPSDITPIKKVDPLPYKMPEQFIKAFNMGINIAGIHETSLHRDAAGDVHEAVIKIISDTTTSLQELNKEFYNFAGKWKPHMTEHATLDIDKMRQTIIDNTHSIDKLKEKEASLETQNKSLQEELKQLKEQKATLDNEKAKLLPLKKYKDAVIEFMNEHYDGDEPYDSSDSEELTIKWFNDWHSNKIFMDQCDWIDVMSSKEELDEYRIYKKVKSEMVSNGMDNSSVARNVMSIKRQIKQINTT